MSNFKHLDGMVALLSEVYEINERIMTGDICSSKTSSTASRSPDHKSPDAYE